MLKVNPSDSATITAKTVPEKIQDDLTFKWFYVSDRKDSLLIQGADYTFYPNNLNESIPNKLVVLDKEGNQQVYEFNNSRKRGYALRLAIFSIPLFVE